MTNMNARRALGAIALIAVSSIGSVSAVAQAPARDTPPGSFCPAGYLCGQNWAVGSTWLYSDLGYTYSGMTGRVTSEQFPPPSEPPLTQPISLISWYGATIDEGSSPCTKPHSFRIEFYNDDGTGKPDCAHPVVTYSHIVPQVDDTGEVHCFAPFVQCAPVTRFTVRLPALLTMPSGHFSIVSDNIEPDCFFMLAGSPEGNDLTWRWYEAPTPCYFYGSQGDPGAPYPGDIAYCLQPAVTGACCLDCTATCTQSDDFTCGQLGGRFTAGATCAQLDPPCGAALGACCTDLGGCTLTTCGACVPATQACCLPDQSCLYVTSIECAEHGGAAQGVGTTCSPVNPCGWFHSCVGDLNCDETIRFSDINPFVLYLSNFANWQLAYPGCNSKNGDINCDGTYPSFDDINAFVALLSTNPIPQCPHLCPDPAPEPRAQGNVWGGPGTTCDPNDASYGCCTVVAGNPKENEPHNCVEDHFNSGCNSIPPPFSTLPGLATPIYGESGTFDTNRDMDWYSYTSVAPSIFTVMVHAEFPPAIYVVHDDDYPSPVCVSHWTTDLPASGLPCSAVTLVTHCLPPGRYYFVVTPNAFTGVACGADYKLTVDAAPCEPCAIICTPDYTELSACNDDPNHVDENGGCYTDPNNPMDPNSFETLPLVLNEPYTVCGTTWANEGARDLDWFRFTMTQRFCLNWYAESEVPLRATLLVNEVNGVSYPPTCDSFQYYSHSLVTPCTPLEFDGEGIVYQPGTYWFLVYPQLDEYTGLWYGYPCDRGNPYHDYKITFVLLTCACPDPCLDPAFNPTLQESEPECGPGYVDVTDGGCDAGAPYMTKPILAIGSTGLNYDYCGAFGAWLEEPNNPATVQYDYDWYEFTTPATPANGRWFIYLYSEYPATWEIWPADTCAGPLEGLEMPLCYGMPVRPGQCYPANTRYWLRVYPTDASAPCGTSHYYLGMFNYGGCSPCSINCSGATDNDDACGAPDTNEGCNGYPINPSHFLTFAVGSTYCGRSYASAGTYDPDWFKMNLAAVTHLRLRVQAEFPAFVGLYYAGTNFANPSCTAYSSHAPVNSMSLLAACSGTTPTNLNFPNLAAGVYVGVIYPIDYFGNLLTNYYPCTSTHNDYKIIVTTYVP